MRHRSGGTPDGRLSGLEKDLLKEPGQSIDVELLAEQQGLYVLAPQRAGEPCAAASRSGRERASRICRR